MSDIPDDIRHTAIRAIRDIGWSTTYDDEIDIIARAILTERERCAKFADAWDSPSALRLAAGEMTAQEMRTARAVARGIASAIRTP